MKQILSFLTAFFLTSQAYCQTEEREAFNFINEAMREEPGNADLLFMRGLLYFELEKYDSAIADFNAALKNLKAQKNISIFQDSQSLDSAEILRARAQCYEHSGAVDSAIADYRYLQFAKPKDIAFSIAVARLWIRRKDFEKAQTEIDRLKKLPEIERGLVYQSILFFEMDKPSDALDAAEIALKKYPDSIEGLIIKAKALAKLSKTEEACNSLTEASNKLTLEYFGGERGYQRDFEEEIADLKTLYCK